MYLILLDYFSNKSLNPINEATFWITFSRSKLVVNLIVDIKNYM